MPCLVIPDLLEWRHDRFTVSGASPEELTCRCKVRSNWPRRLDPVQPDASFLGIKTDQPLAESKERQCQPPHHAWMPKMLPTQQHNANCQPNDQPRWIRWRSNVDSHDPVVATAVHTNKRRSLAAAQTAELNTNRHQAV